jgi:hypothetical protein
VRSLRRSPSLFPVLVAALLALGHADCRRFELCGPEDEACAPPEGSAGAAGTEELGCSAPILSCDESPLNGCETDTTYDSDHCGRCNHVCDGCAGGECVAIQRVTDDEVVLEPGLAASTDHVYFLVTSSTQHTVLRRMSKQNGAVSTVLDGLYRDQRRYTGLTMGLDRVYFVDDGRLHSVPVSEPALVDEGVATNVAPVVNGEYLYVWTTGGALLRRQLTSGEEEVIEPWDPNTVSSWAELAATETSVVVGAGVREGSGTGWELRRVDWPDSRLIATGAGALRRIRTFSGFDFDVVWLVEYPDGGGPSELFGHGGTDSDSLPDLIATDEGFTDFCLSSDLAYASFVRSAKQGLRIVAKPAPARATVGLSYQAAALLCDAGTLYFCRLDGPGLYRATMQDLWR